MGLLLRQTSAPFVQRFEEIFLQFFVVFRVAFAQKAFCRRQNARDVLRMGCHCMFLLLIGF